MHPAVCIMHHASRIHTKLIHETNPIFTCLDHAERPHDCPCFKIPYKTTFPPSNVPQNHPFAALLFLMLFNMHRASKLLRKQVRLNRDLATTNSRLAEARDVLEAEKATREALLMRQYDLISCFAQVCCGDGWDVWRLFSVLCCVCWRGKG